MKPPNARVGAARSTAIAQAIDVEPKQITGLLQIPVERGYLNVCKIERPGKKDENEYRLSTAGQGMSWEEFKAISISRDVSPFIPLPTAPKSVDRAPTQRRGASHPLAPTSPPPASATPADQAQVSATTVPAETVAVPPSCNPPAEASETPVPVAVPAAPAREGSPDIEFGLWSSGRLSIIDGDSVLILAPEDTRRLRTFLSCFAEEEAGA